LSVDELVIRAYEVDDARELMEAITESIEHLRPWMPWIKYEPQDVHDKRRLIKEFSNEWAERTGFTMAIFEGSRLVGASGFHVRGPEDSLEIGYWVRFGYTGRGIATRAARGLVNEAFQHDSVRRVFINHDESNLRSRMVPERLGFTIHEITQREPLAPADSGTLISWVLTREAWEAQ
jgi:RimJ/RimL family protein N-acetyltransferase